jgi:hypothetical protein
MQQIIFFNVVKEELLFVNDATQFCILKVVQYIMPKIPKIEEQPTRYMTLSIVVMEPQEAFTGRVMKQINI